MKRKEGLLAFSQAVEEHLIEILQNVPRGVKVSRLYITPEEALAVSVIWERKGGYPIGKINDSCVRRSRVEAIHDFGSFMGVKLFVRENPENFGGREYEIVESEAPVEKGSPLAALGAGGRT